MYWITVRMHTTANVQTLRRSVDIGFLSIESGKRGLEQKAKEFAKTGREVYSKVSTVSRLVPPLWNMPAYDFTTLSPIDFEILVRDLLQREFGFTLESFKPGKDKGIDLRRFIAPGDSLIVQCKHYAGSGFNALARDLEREEAPKVQRLKPRRYLLATSVPLSPGNKETICDIFKPFCHSPGDIYGRDDLNNLLGKYDDIERQHLKLWITSASVLESIVHSQLYNTSREELEKIQRRSKVYVYNQSFAEALEILTDRNFCIIAGIPGIGKTTLAEMLVLYFLSNGFELIRITANIREASAVSSNKRRVFYYDDFLGQSSDADKFEKTCSTIFSFRICRHHLSKNFLRIARI